MSALVLDAVTKEHPAATPVRALCDVTLRVAAGEFVAVTGASGSGKSTLLAVAGTLERPTSGSVQVAGTAVESMSDADLSAVRSNHLGFVFQQFHLLPTRSVLQNVSDGLLYRGVPASERLARAADAVAAVGLAHRRTHRPAELSGGECQRVAIARALINEPQLLLADEPTGNLDTKTAEQVIDRFFDVVERRGVTLLLVTHNDRLAKRCALHAELREGRLWF